MSGENKKAAVKQALTGTREELLDLLTGLSLQMWQKPVYSDEAQSAWNVVDVLRHLANAEQGMTGLMVHIQAGRNPVPPDFDRERYNRRVVEKAQGKTPDQLLAEMAENRKALLQFIDTIGEEDWPKRGRHASLKILSIEEICSLIGRHEAGHIAEVKRALELE